MIAENNPLFDDFDFDRYNAEQEAANMSTEAPVDQKDDLVPGNEFERSSNRSSSSPRLQEQRGNTKRKRSQGQHNLLDAIHMSNGVIRQSPSIAAAAVEHWRATARVCLGVAVQNGPNQGLGVAVKV